MYLMHLAPSAVYSLAEVSLTRQVSFLKWALSHLCSKLCINHASYQLASNFTVHVTE